MESTTTTSQTTTTTESKYTGMVKWFNKTTGFGFITALDGEHQSKDIFTHYSAITVSNSLYKYLVQGEYVEFSVISTKNDKHELQTAGVVGIKSGPLMCETRSLNSPPPGKRESRPSRQHE